MPAFKINEGYPEDTETVKAHEMVSNGDFVDFLDKNGVIIFRMHASKVLTVRRRTRSSASERPT